MKIIKVESCFMCPLSDVFKDLTIKGSKPIVYCCHEDGIGRLGEGIVTGMGTEGIWDKCPLEDAIENNKG